MKRCINFILNALYGREYYAVIVGERGSDRFDLTSRIHRTPEEAEAIGKELMQVVLDMQ